MNVEGSKKVPFVAANHMDYGLRSSCSYHSTFLFQVKVWFQDLLVPVFKKDKVNDAEGVRAREVLTKEIADAPKVKELIEEGKKCGVDENKIVMELLYMTMLVTPSVGYVMCNSPVLFLFKKITEKIE